MRSHIHTVIDQFAFYTHTVMHAIGLHSAARSGVHQGAMMTVLMANFASPSHSVTQ